LKVSGSQFGTPGKRKVLFSKNHIGKSDRSIALRKKSGKLTPILKKGPSSASVKNHENSENRENNRGVQIQNYNININMDSRSPKKHENGVTKKEDKGFMHHV
jgi:hypothetical protein